MPSCSAVSSSRSKRRSLSGAPRASDGPCVDADVAHLLDLALGDVPRPRHVDRDRDVGAHRERGRAGAGEVADLLADRRDRDDVARRAARLGDATRGLERDVAADTVVPRARGESVVAQLDGLRREHGSVAEADDRARLVPVARADVDEEVLHLDLLVLVLLERAPLLADHAGEAPVARHHLDALREQHLGLPAADAAEPEEALVVDVRDRKADLVDVARRSRASARRPCP